MSVSLLSLSVCLWLAASMPKHQKAVFRRQPGPLLSKILRLSVWALMFLCCLLWVDMLGISIGLSVAVVVLGLLSAVPLLLLTWKPAAILPTAVVTLLAGGVALLVF